MQNACVNNVFKNITRQIISWYQSATTTYQDRLWFLQLFLHNVFYFFFEIIFFILLNSQNNLHHDNEDITVTKDLFKKYIFILLITYHKEDHTVHTLYSSNKNDRRRNKTMKIFFCTGKLMKWKVDTALKGPMHEMFIAEFFAQSKPVWVDDLESRQKKFKICLFGSLVDHSVTVATLNGLGSTPYCRQVCTWFSPNSCSWQ